MGKNNTKELVIIGAGPGGYAAAFRAADLGLKVTLIDPEANPGGVCLYRGCIPSKSLLHLVKIKRDALKAEDFGLVFKEPKIDIKKIRKWKDQVVEKLTKGLGQLSKSRNIEFIRGRAELVSDQAIKVELEDGEVEEINFENLILATGSEAISLPEIEIDHKVIIDSTDALELNEIPDKMLVIGGGYIGLELGSVYAGLGSKVSIAEMTSGYLPGADRDLVKIFEKETEGFFDEVFFDTKVDSISVKKGKATVSMSTSEDSLEKKYDKVLIAVGRQPNTASLKLENADVKVDNQNFIPVDEKRRTNVKNIYAIGDLTGEPLLAHKASHEGRVAAEVIAGKKGAGYDPKVIPGIVFTDPEIAWCGLTEIQAEEREIEIKVLKFPWSASGRAASIGTTNGITKLIIEPNSGRILGGAVAGKNAGTLIPEICLAIEMAATAEEIALTIHPHPTLSETIMEAAELYIGSPTHLPPK